MELYEVIFEADGKTVKAPGVSETEVQRLKYYYAARSPERVWEAIAEMRNDPEKGFVSMARVLYAVTILEDVQPESES